MDLEVENSIVPIGEFKASAARILRELAEGRGPIVVTQNGRAAGVVLSPAEFDAVRRRTAFLEALASGLADIQADRTLDDSALDDYLAEDIDA